MTVDYEGVNSAGRLSVTWRFDEHGIWTEPIVYEAPAGQDVVSVHYFSDVKDGNPSTGAACKLPCGSRHQRSRYRQPHCSRRCDFKRKRLAGKGQFRTGAFAAVGLAGALLLRLQRGRFKRRTEQLHRGPIGCLYLRPGRSAGRRPVSSARLGQEQPVGELSRRFVEAYARTGADRTGRDALLVQLRRITTMPLPAYYQGLLRAGVIHKSQPSEKKIARALAPQFCTWGSQVDRRKDDRHWTRRILPRSTKSSKPRDEGGNALH